MKKLLIVAVVVLLGSCTPVPKQSDTEEKNTYIINRNKHADADQCDYENLPRFPKRPKLTRSEISKMTESEMDERIKKHITALERHIDTLESVIVRTRNRFDQCR